MDKRIEMLGVWGCDIKGAMARMLDDEEFYLDCLESIPEDANFEELKETVKAKDAKRAFDCAHTLKGVLANVGITPMYEKAVEIVEPLRAGECENLEGKVEELLAMKNHLAEILKQA